jgi:energy-coupling factor transporter ATP-binding protein EcfA2
VHGARVNNLKDVSIELPKRRLTVFTGVSGSGKSSLVFATIAAESQRLNNATYSASCRPSCRRWHGRRSTYSMGPKTAIIVDQQRMGADARSVVVAALRASDLREVPVEDQTAVLRLWARRCRDLASAWTQLVCRLHAVLWELVPGGLAKKIIAAQATVVLAELPARGEVDTAQLESAQLLREYLTGTRSAPTTGSTGTCWPPTGTWSGCNYPARNLTFRRHRPRAQSGSKPRNETPWPMAGSTVGSTTSVSPAVTGRRPSADLNWERPGQWRSGVARDARHAIWTIQSSQGP